MIPTTFSRKFCSLALNLAPGEISMPSSRSLLCVNRSITQRGKGEDFKSRLASGTQKRALNRAGHCPAQFLLGFPLHVAGGCRAPKFLVAAGSGSQSPLMPQSGGLEFRAAPTAWGCRTRTTRPTGHDTVTLCLYSAKGQCSLSVFVRTTRRAGECQNPVGKPQVAGGECAPDNPQQPVTVRG
jgi:hypothetical protein